jgi:glycolate oxidase FAD binding subunit
MIAMQAILDDFAQRIRDAARTQTPLRFRGGGSKDFYGQSLQGDVLDTRAYSGVISYEPSELVITVRAGTRLAEVEQLLAQ